MQFLVLGYDGTDEGAKERRANARPDHIAMGDKLVESGNLWYGAALTNDDGDMIGSMYVVDFENEAALKQWLRKEPYVVGDVWRKTEIKTCQTRDPSQFNRPKEFFEERQK